MGEVLHKAAWREDAKAATWSRATRLRDVATGSAGYVAFALVAVLIQTHRVVEGDGSDPAAVTWLVWWVLSGLAGLAVVVVGLVGSIVLGGIARAIEPPDPPPPVPWDHYT
jgi:uncharacterized membrane protein (DUF4010 family)